MIEGAKAVSALAYQSSAEAVRMGIGPKKSISVDP